MRSLKNTASLKNLMLPGFIILLLLIVWEGIVTWMKVESWILPKPHAIFIEIWKSKALIIDHSIQTIYETLLGLGLSIIAAIITATLIDVSEWVRRAIYPLLVISQTIPIIAVAPLLIMWFGYGILPKVLVVALVCYFPITINLADGYRLVEREMIRVLTSMNATSFQIFKMVKVPATLPYFFTGLRIGGTYSVMGAVIGEMLGASKGLGILLTRSTQSFLAVRVFATIFIITLLSLAIYMTIEGLARATMPWKNQRYE